MEADERSSERTAGRQQLHCLVSLLPWALLCIVVACSSVRFSERGGQADQAVPQDVAARAISVALSARIRVLGDSTPVYGCTVMRALGSTPDYVALLAPEVRPLLTVLPDGEPCFEEPVPGDPDRTTAAVARAFRQMFPSLAGVLSVDSGGGDTIVVVLTIRRGQLAYREEHRMTPGNAGMFLGSNFVHSGIRIGPILIL